MLQPKEQIGRLDRRITFQEKIIGTNASNEDEQLGWQDVITVWSAVTDYNGNEQLQADQIEAVQTTEFTIRYRSVDVKWRISFDGQYYDIIATKRPDRKGYLKVTAIIGVDYQETTT